MVNNESQARAEHAEYFQELLREGEHRRYVVRVVEGDGDSYTVIVNHDALRRSLEGEGIIRRFGR